MLVVEIIDEILISASNLNKSYGRVEVLKQLNLEVKKKQFTCILGISGSGKTTLLNILAGLLPPSSGEIIISNENLYGPNKEQIRVNNIGMIFQKFELLDHMTALDNVFAAGLFHNTDYKEVMYRASNLLREVNLEEHIYKYPYQLSSGQKQRVGIARALMNNPTILIGDEPSGSLDEKTGSSIMNLLRSFIEKGRSMIYSTHNINIAKFADQIYILKDGLLSLIDIETLEDINKLKDLYVDNVLY